MTIDTTSMTLEQLQAHVANLQKQLDASAPPVSGKLNHSKPREDGRKGSAFFGSIKLAANAEPGATYNVAVYENVNSQTGESFYNIVFRGKYEPQAQAPQTAAA